ncbi:histidine kinase [Acinetobacter baumannii]|nr:histidine kinase [Acinetobacter baumannii]
MSTRLIAHLKKKCEADDNVKILLSQWEFDQKLVGKALENIGGFYPHFSNHNASHSQQILVNIERILGDDIDLLSATDTWLILEAAYWHDVGMLVDAKNAKEVHSNPDFNFMIQTIANEKGHDLQKFCQAYVEKNWLSAIGTVDHPFDGIEQYRQLVAEWFRRGHDKRVGKIVEDPFKDLGITSPRTELLPNRIYRYLGQICVSHGMNFDTLMDTIPYKQTGLGTEDCHPRFIGCLLRLGDLFDLDDNRFCPVMAKHVSNMPSVSKHHHDKHLSLREFQLDKRTVKLVAECPDEMSYVETQNWFGWIREEFQNQMSQWNLIVPSLKFGSLPTIEQLEVKMEVKYEKGVRKEKILLNNKPMKFTIDEKNGMELLQGANLYNSDLSIYRELMQNAIDATMLRIWLEEDQELLTTLHPYHEEFFKLLKKYPISVRLEKKYQIENTLNSIWELSINDNGIGISLHDLNYMKSMAGSNKNEIKKKIIKEMPYWMRPSGEFGIGLHSAFLLLKNLPDNDNKISFSTNSYISNETLNIDMYSPLGEKKGYCFITKISYDLMRKDTGTSLKINYKYDFFKNIKVHGFKDVTDYWNLSYLENKWKNILLGEIIKKISDTPFVNSEKIYEENNYLWDRKKDIAFRFKFSLDQSNSVNAKFKRQLAKFDYRYGIHRLLRSLLVGIQYDLDCYGYQAKEVLQVNRDYWKNDFLAVIRENIFNHLNLYLCEFDSPEISIIKVLVKNKKYNWSFSIGCRKWLDYVIDFKKDRMSFNQMIQLGEVYFYDDYFLESKTVEDLRLNEKRVVGVDSISSIVEVFKMMSRDLKDCGLSVYEYSNSRVRLIALTNKKSSKLFNDNKKWKEICDLNKVENNMEVKIEINKNLNNFFENFINDKIEGFAFSRKFGYGFPCEIIHEKYKNLFVEDILISPYQPLGEEYRLTDLESLSKIIYYYKINETDKNFEWYFKKYHEFLNEIDILIDANNLRNKFMR